MIENGRDMNMKNYSRKEMNGIRNNEIERIMEDEDCKILIKGLTVFFL